MDDTEIRIRLVELMASKASQFGITNPEVIIEACSQLERYVLGSNVSEDSLTSTTRRRRSPQPGKAKSL